MPTLPYQKPSNGPCSPSLKKNKRKFINKWASKITLPIVLAALVAAIYFRFVMFQVEVPTGSMSPTIKPFDQLKVSRDQDVQYGDIVVFYSDEEGELLVKRLIGKSGDCIEIREGVLYRNSEKIDEPYVVYQDYGTGTYDVPEGTLFFLGDNRLASLDARYWQNPYIPEDKVVGIAKFIVYPYTRLGGVH